MTKYVALLRGISPAYPNMRNEKLRHVFTSLGFTNIQTVISSGNVIFETRMSSQQTLEEKIEKAVFEMLGFQSTVIIRSREDLEKLIKSDPFKDKMDAPRSRLNVSFLKKGGEIFSRVDFTSTTTPEIMKNIEKEHGKGVTTRTWKTVLRIVSKLN
ncbi:MAG: hypothetical protein A2Z16_00395 [Chloroflexi bacterium RBG_16_54_18]|nr:MAG: hypothetical protein A2Z16_00395 [Chloroflexi bacterium RBG_16_54_18]